MYQYLDALKSRGIESSVEALAPWNGGSAAVVRGVTSRVRMVRGRPGSADILIVQKEPIMPPQLWTSVRRRLETFPIPILWDVDDAVWIGRRGARRMAEDMARIATVVVAGNELIGAWASSSGAPNVRVIPTCYSPPLTPVSVEPRSEFVELVWIGSPATAQLLADEGSQLEQILQAPGSRLTMVGGAAPRGLSPANAIREVSWSPQAEHEALCSADLGVALQPRTEYADHKCGFKTIQYMAYGVIPIATDNPVHRRIMGGLGMLVTPETSAKSLQTFVAAGVAPADRSAVRQRWVATYSTDVGTAAWTDLLFEVAG